MGQAQKNQEDKIRPFLAYEFGEAAFNKFQSLSGEIGVKFPNNYLLRLTHMNVNLSEKHLASSFAGAVDGSDVRGKMFGFEAFYDIPIAWKTLYISPSVGYYRNEYKHTVLDEAIENKTATIGAGISYRETNLFKVKGLYYTLSLPMRISLNPIKKTTLGETTIRNNAFDNNIWLFIGFQF